MYLSHQPATLKRWQKTKHHFIFHLLKYKPHFALHSKYEDMYPSCFMAKKEDQSSFSGS